MDSVLSIEKLSKRFPPAEKPALNKVSLQLAQGECLGLVGESGSGKSTLARMILGLLQPDTGSIEVLGQDVTALRGGARRSLYRSVQMVLQSRNDAFNPQLSLKTSLREFGRLAGLNRTQADTRAKELFERVGLDPRLLERRAGSLSGGQAQRAAIARALMPSPKLLVCDEVTSALDVSTQAGIIELLASLVRDTGLSLLFISHDIALLYSLCDRLAIMKEGSIVEDGPLTQILSSARQPYTRQLIDAVPSMKS